MLFRSIHWKRAIYVVVVWIQLTAFHLTPQTDIVVVISRYFAIDYASHHSTCHRPFSSVIDMLIKIEIWPLIFRMLSRDIASKRWASVTRYTRTSIFKLIVVGCFFHFTLSNRWPFVILITDCINPIIKLDNNMQRLRIKPLINWFTRTIYVDVVRKRGFMCGIDEETHPFYAVEMTSFMWHPSLLFSMRTCEEHTKKKNRSISHIQRLILSWHVFS